MAYQTIPEIPATVAQGPGYFPKTPNAADVKLLEVKGNIARDKLKARAEAHHDLRQAAITADRDVRLAGIDAAHTQHQAGIQAERDARQAGYQSAAEQQAAQHRGALAEQQNQFHTEHARLLDEFQQGRDHRQAGYESEADYRRAAIQSARDQRQAEINDELQARHQGRQGQIESGLAQQRFGQQQELQRQQGDIQAQHTDQQGFNQGLLQLGHAQLTDWLHRNQLTTQETARMNRLRSEMAALDDNPNLSPAERANLRTQMQTGLDPLHQRVVGSQLATQELHRRAMDDAHASESAHFNATQQAMSQSAQQRMQVFQDQNGNSMYFMPDAQGRLTHVPNPNDAREDRNAQAEEGRRVSRENALRLAQQFHHQQMQHAIDAEDKRRSDPILNPAALAAMPARPGWHTAGDAYNVEHARRVAADIAQREAYMNGRAPATQGGQPVPGPTTGGSSTGGAGGTPRVSVVPPAFQGVPAAQNQAVADVVGGLAAQPATDAPSGGPGGVRGGVGPGVEINPAVATPQPDAARVRGGAGEGGLHPGRGPVQQITPEHAGATIQRIDSLIEAGTAGPGPNRRATRLGEMRDILARARGANRSLNPDERARYEQLHRDIADDPRGRNLASATELPGGHQPVGATEGLAALEGAALRHAESPEGSRFTVTGMSAHEVNMAAKDIAGILQNARENHRGLTTWEVRRYKELLQTIRQHREAPGTNAGILHDQLQLPEGYGATGGGVHNSVRGR